MIIYSSHSRYVKNHAKVKVRCQSLNGKVSETQGSGFIAQLGLFGPGCQMRWHLSELSSFTSSVRFERQSSVFASSSKPGPFTQGCLSSHHFPQPRRTSGRLLRPILEGIFQFNILSSFGIDTLLIRNSFEEEETSRILLAEQPSQWKSTTANKPAGEQKLFQTKR